jgi:alginate O-acetyltransferase complex protein AlgI
VVFHAGCSYCILDIAGAFRNGLISVASLIFYSWGAGAFVFGLLTCIVVNFAVGIAIDSAALASRPRARKWVLTAAVVLDLGILAIWKYAGFASHQIDEISHGLGLGHTPLISLALPIGISFFTFHHLSYVMAKARDFRYS